MSSAQPELSVVVPALNEQHNLEPLVDRLHQVTQNAGIDTEMIVVDDGSTDKTLDRLLDLRRRHDDLRVLHRPHSMGQSAALWAGIQEARGRFIATLDADLQNDPADLPSLLKLLHEGRADMVQGDRSSERHDSYLRRLSSWVGRMARRLILSDATRDTGCSTRIMRAEFAKKLPLQFRGVHRFIPVYVRMLGATVIEVTVCHRPRVSGVTKYGVWNRALVGLIDCFAVRWMLRRHCEGSVEEMGL